LVTNQANVGRGVLSMEAFEKIQSKLVRDLANHGACLCKTYVCTDTEVEPNNRRKPAPGMLWEAMADHQIPVGETIMIGDDWRDLEAAQKAGCDAILVRTGKGRTTEERLAQEPLSCVIAVVDDVLAAAHMINRAVQKLAC
jgi:D-glycero-D-manno-heptose 1,7-bisphosphate phosphatase